MGKLHKEREREGHKFIVYLSVRGKSDGPVSESERKVQEERSKRRAELEALQKEEVPVTIMKGTDGDW